MDDVEFVRGFHAFAGEAAVQLAVCRDPYKQFALLLSPILNDLMVLFDRTHREQLPVQTPTTQHTQHHYHGPVQNGDSFVNTGLIVGTALGRAARATAGEVFLYTLNTAQRSGDADLVSAVNTALEAVTRATLAETEKREAAELVGKIQTEVVKAEGDADRLGRLKRWLANLATVCQPAADAIRAAEAVRASLQQ